MQIQVKHGHISYDSGLFDLRVGDVVVLPPLPWHHTSTWTSVVTRIGEANSNYDGPLKTVIGAFRGSEILKPVVPIQVVSSLELVDVLVNAKVIVVDGVTYTRREVWVRS